MNFLAATALAGIALSTVACATRQDVAAGAKPAAPTGMTQAEMDAYAAAASTGDMHAWLAGMAGTWKGAARNWPSATGEPMSADVTLDARMELGGRFLMNHVRSEWPGVGTFEGRGTVGYDTVQRAFVATWCDNMGTGMMNGTGQLSEDRKALTVTYEYVCPVRKRKVTLRETIVRENPDRLWVRIWSTAPADDKEYLMMETTYLRQAGPAAPAAPSRPRVLNDGRGDRD